MVNNIIDIVKLIKETARKVEDTHEQFLTNSIVKKAKLAANRFPNDSTITGIYGALLNKKESFISRAELNKYFDYLNTGHSRFQEIFAQELGVTASHKCHCESEKCDHGKSDDWKSCKRKIAEDCKIVDIGQVCKKCYENYPEKYHVKNGTNKCNCQIPDKHCDHGKKHCTRTGDKNYRIDEIGVVCKTCYNNYPESYRIEDETEKSSSISPPINHAIFGAFVSHFNKSLPYKPYGPEISKKAERACLYELSSFGLLPKKIETVGGQETTLLCRASYDTPKGENSVFIPVEIINGKACLPSTFVSIAGFMKLNKEDLETHIKGTAGKRQEINVKAVLDKISQAKDSQVDSAVSTAVLKHAITQANPVQSSNQMLCIRVDEPAKPLPKIEYQVSKEAEKIVESVFSKEGLAQLSFGKNLVVKAKEMVNFLLKKAGYSNNQISVTGNDKEYIYFAVSLAPNMGFKVPVKVAKNQISEPHYIICNGELLDFSSRTISAMFAKNKSDNQMVAIASPMYHLSENKLIEEIAEAISEQNYLKAEEVLHILKQSGNVDAFKKGFIVYSKGLKPEISEDPGPKCNRQYKTANSVHIMCGHTNLPLHKVYQDERGICHPNYRKYVEKPETASFAYSKIHFS